MFCDVISVAGSVLLLCRDAAITSGGASVLPNPFSLRCVASASVVVTWMFGVSIRMSRICAISSPMFTWKSVGP